LARTADVLHIQMVGKAEGRPIDVAEHYFNPKRFPELEARVREAQSISRALAQFGIADYTRKWSRITAAMPSAPVARLLNQPKTRPVLQVEALNADIDGAPVQYSMTRFAGDWVQLTVSDND